MKQIKSLPLGLRPREKLLKMGAEALAMEELVSAILITGNKGIPVSKFSNKIVSLLQDKKLSKNSLFQLGLGPSKTAQVLAAIELSKRLAIPDRIAITKPEQVFIHSYEIVHPEKETLLCLYLNARGELIKKEIIAVGSLNRVQILPHEIFSVVKELPVSGIILVHNHPSGVLDASKDDILFTKRIKKAGDILGIKLLDHIIISQKGWKQVKYNQ